VAKILAFFAQTTASFSKNWTITLVFEKNAIFSPKIGKNCDHNIGPCTTKKRLTLLQRFSGLEIRILELELLVRVPRDVRPQQVHLLGLLVVRIRVHDVDGVCKRIGNQSYHFGNNLFVIRT
jgi:hypothetical protein